MKVATLLVTARVGQLAQVEWDKWKHFNDENPVSGPELEQLLVQGHKPIPLQWVDIDRNEQKRREDGPHVAPLFKSRLVSRGDLEETTGVRTDSPTCDIEGLDILFSWVSCERLTVKSGDITNAYFQGCPSVPAHVMLAVVLWKKLRHDILSTGLKEKAVIRATVHIPRTRRTQFHACDSCR